MKRFTTHLLLAISPFFAAWALELFVFPIDAFTFRPWEAMNVRYARMVFPGPFYPNRSMTRSEQGDLGHHTPWAVERTVTWSIDSEGFRNTPDRPGMDVLIIGDSAVVGGGLDQDELYSERLEAESGLAVFPDAPGLLNDAFQDPRFVQARPRIVIFVKTERHLEGFGLPASQPQRAWIPGADNPVIRALAYYGDRFMKQTMIRFLRARVDNLYRPEPQAFEKNSVTMMFREGAAHDRGVDPARVREIVKSLVAHRDAHAARGVRFLFVPVPNKETILYDFIPGSQRGDFLRVVIDEAKKAGVETVDTLTLFEELRDKEGKLLFLSDDSHWNADGAAAAAKATAELIRSRR